MIVKSYQQKVDKQEPTEDVKKFWKYTFKYYIGVGSGANNSIDGWMINFFPYIDNRKSEFAQRTLEEMI